MKAGLFFLFSSLLVGAGDVNAKVTLPSVYSSNMVLQQKSKVKIWGKSDNPQKWVEVTTSWDKKKYRCTVDADGNWNALLSTPSFGGPFSIQIADGDQLVLDNILIGEVWFCSGQSNMEMPLEGWGHIQNYATEIQNAQFPNIRLLQVKQETSDQPKSNADVTMNGWQPASPQTVPNFSATAYFFAREVYQKTGIPVGLIHSSWGGTIIEAWMSAKALGSFKEFSQSLTLLSSKTAKDDHARQVELWNQLMDENDKGNQRKDLGWLAASVDTRSWQKIQLPSFFDEKVYHGVDGIVYFRKEVQIPDAWIGKPIQLSLGPVDDNDWTYVNGVKVGETQGYNVDRHYTIPASVVTGNKLTIAIKDYDGGGGGGIYGDAHKLKLVGANGDSLSLAGEWAINLGVDFAKLPARPAATDGPNRPTVLFNAMVNPFVDFKVRGAIWYQGESNADRADAYYKLLPAMIQDWRNHWQEKDMAFYIVQLANYMAKDATPQESNWAKIRDAQLQTSKLPNNGLAVIGDIGDEHDIHPKNKQEVGRRLALAALHDVYKKPGIYSGPKLKIGEVKGNSITLTFDPIGKQLVNRDAANTALKGFAIAGNDGKYYNANAVIKGNQVIIISDKVATPVSVRYGWANNPDLSLYNDGGLPASPFEWSVNKK